MVFLGHVSNAWYSCQPILETTASFCREVTNVPAAAELTPVGSEAAAPLPPQGDEHTYSSRLSGIFLFPSARATTQSAFARHETPQRILVKADLRIPQ